MNRLIILLCILFFSGCQVLNINKKPSNKQLKEITIHARATTELSSLGPIKLKTKINVFEDSIVVSALHTLGVEIANLTITNQAIYIDQKLQNKKDSLIISEFAPKFKLKNIKKFITRPKEHKDTTAHQSSTINCAFTNYTEKNNLFLPQKIFFKITSDINTILEEGQISLNYKSITFSSKKKQRK
tara:strand:+ start:741 stop:1298 length:558 start_codon:yes stop_codon:yes gene_type:complete